MCGTPKIWTRFLGREPRLPLKQPRSSGADLGTGRAGRRRRVPGQARCYGGRGPKSPRELVASSSQTGPTPNQLYCVPLPLSCCKTLRQPVVRWFSATRRRRLRAALILRAAWMAAREDAHDLSRLPGARAQTWLLVVAWRRMAVFGPVRPAQTAPTVSATITSIVEGISGGSAAHIARHAAPEPAAPAPDTGPAAAGSSSSHAALPAPTAATTGFTATAPREAGERAPLRPSRGRARTNTLRRQADASSPQSATMPQTQRTSAAKDAVATSSGFGDPRFPEFGRMGCGAASGTVAASAGVRARKRMRAEEVSALREGMEQWRHTGLVAEAPPANSESDEGCEPERGIYLVIPQRAKVPSRARATGAGSKAAGSAPTGFTLAQAPPARESQNGCAQVLRQGEITPSGRGLLTGWR